MSPVEFRVRRLDFIAGVVPGAPGANLDLGPVTVFVGPNNSGKSLALRELLQWASQGAEPSQPWPGGRVLAAVVGAWPPNEAALDEFLRPWEVHSDDGTDHRLIRTMSVEPAPGPGMGGSGVMSVRRFGRYGESLEEYCRTAILPVFTVLLDGRSRFNLSEPRQMTTLREPAGNHFMALVRDRDLYERVDTEILEVFGYHLVVDTSQPPNVFLALSRAFPPAGHWPERSYDPEVIQYQVRAIPINEFSDGVQIYTGLTAAIESISRILVLIDEPEAFLHPTLARRLGARLAAGARDRQANLVAATHSADFLLGCVSEVPETAIVRLTYDDGAATARPLAGVDVAQLIRDPLLRSVDALGALFARGAVVCEADSDRVFYDEINRRLLDGSERVGAADTLFLNAQNWQTIPKIVAPLRRLGVPAAAIVDLDAVARDEAWPEFISAATSDSATREELQLARRSAARILLDAGTVGTAGVLACKQRGIDAVANGSDRVVVENALTKLANYGVFAVPVGELERWLRQFGITNKKTWVTEMLVRLGSKSDAAYVSPGHGDVWDFVESVAAWVNDPARAGMP
jgi:hypothetical protein